MSDIQYQTAYRLCRTLHHYSQLDAYGEWWTELKALPSEVRQAAARSYNLARKSGTAPGGNGHEYLIPYCPECGCMMLPGGIDDVSAPASVGPYGDPMCARCASRYWREAEREWDDGIDYGAFDGIPW